MVHLSLGEKNEVTKNSEPQMMPCESKPSASITDHFTNANEVK